MASIRTMLGWSAAISLVAMAAVAVIGCETDELPDGLTFQLPDSGNGYLPPGTNNYDASSSPDAQIPSADATVPDANAGDAMATDAAGDSGSSNDSGAGQDAGADASGNFDSGGIVDAGNDSAVQIFDASFDGFSLDKDADIKN